MSSDGLGSSSVEQEMEEKEHVPWSGAREGRGSPWQDCDKRTLRSYMVVTLCTSSTTGKRGPWRELVWHQRGPFTHTAGQVAQCSKRPFPLGTMRVK